MWVNMKEWMNTSNFKHVRTSTWLLSKRPSQSGRFQGAGETNIASLLEITQVRWRKHSWQSSFPHLALKGLYAARLLLPGVKNLTTHQNKIAGSFACQVAKDGKGKDKTIWLASHTSSWHCPNCLKKKVGSLQRCLTWEPIFFEKSRLRVLLLSFQTTRINEPTWI